MANKVAYDDSTDKISIDSVEVPQSIFKNIAVAGQADVVADGTSDTLTLVAGTNMTLTTNAGSDSITLASAGSGGTQNLFSTIAVAGQNSIIADTTTDTLTLAAGTGITLTTDQATDTLTITSSAGSGTLSNIVEDTTPQLGGTLDANSNDIDMGTNVLTDTNLGQFITAYGWGDHSGAGYLTSVPAQSFASLTGKPTTLAGYGITDGYTNSDVDTHLNTASAATGEILSWNGSDYAWTGPGGGGGTPAGSDTFVQFNSSGSFGADSDFTYNQATNVLTVGSINATASGTPTLTSNSAINMSVGSSVIIQQNSGGGGFRLGNMTTTERNALAAANGEMIYNTTDNKLQGYENGAWANIISAGSAGITVQDEGGALSTTATTLDFVGAGVTASGTGSTKTITISGNAGSTFTTDVEVTSSGTSGSANLMLNNTDTANNFGKAIEAFRSGITSGKRHQILLGKDSSNNDTSTISYYYDGSASTANRLEFGFWGADSLLNVVADGDVGIGITNPSAKLDVDGNIAYKPDGTNVSSVKAGARNVFNITAPNAPNHYTFNDPDAHWFPTAEDDPILYLRRGETYYFVVNASSHPLEIRTSNLGSAYSTGVTNNASAVGTVIFKVPMSAPATLYYQCTSHGGMGNTINIV